MASSGVWKPLVSEPMPDDSIVDAPSLVVPLLSKTSGTATTHRAAEDNQEDDVQIIGEQSANIKSVDEYVKESYVAALTKKGDREAILALKNYYLSSAGNLLLDIGLRRVFERNLDNSVKRLTRRLKKAPNDSAKLVEELDSAKKELSKHQMLNKPFKSSSRLSCPRCRFSTEFRLVLESHLEVPHLSHRKEYLCNWCDYKSKSSDQIIAHFLHSHKIRCRVEKPLSIHLCRFCPYETNSRRLMASHIISCLRNFPLDSFLGPQHYGEKDYPGVTSRLITQEDIRSYSRARNALLLSSYNPHQISLSGPNEYGGRRQVTLVPRRYLPQNHHHVVCNAEPLADNPSLACNPLQRFANLRQNSRGKKGKGVGNQSKLMQLLAEQNQPLAIHPFVLQHPAAHSLFMNGKTALATASGVLMASGGQRNSNKSNHLPGAIGGPNGAATEQLRHPDNGGSSLVDSPGNSIRSDELPRNNRIPTSERCSFIICEICDCYTKDLMDLKFHMLSIHEIKMHQKRLERRPPLSCQKCNWRFFTDQGLERHLLGVHHFVTSNVQTLVEKDKDSGRCTICGKAFANKLVAHMKEVHKANLKLAHLSYKCTICSAAFNLYSLFENHVLSVHPESAGP